MADVNLKILLVPLNSFDTKAYTGSIASAPRVLPNNTSRTITNRIVRGVGMLIAYCKIND